jgi:uncharacterized protein YegP (UPF0339 family)
MTDYTIQLVTKVKRGYNPNRTSYFWRLKGKNGKTLAHSENYYQKSNAKRMAIKITEDMGADYEEVEE